MKRWLSLFLFAGSALAAPSKILNVSYDVTREFYQEYNDVFSLAYKRKHGLAPTVDLSNGGSSKQARAVIDGLEADVVTMNQETDIDAIARAGLIASNWKTRLPNNSAPYTSTIVFLVRKGNPKGIKDWGDLVRPAVSVIVPNPRRLATGATVTLLRGRMRSRVPAEAMPPRKSSSRRCSRMRRVLETGGRAATNTFVQKEIGDVLLTFESEVLQITKVFSPDKFDVVYPPLSILAEAPVSVVDKVVDRRGTRKLATAYLEYLWSDEGQKLAVQSYFRPRSEKLLAENAALFPLIKLVSVDEVFGGWDAVQKAHFADGGYFDQIYQAK